MATNIDEQLAKAEAKVKRLKQKKTLVEAKNAIAENGDLKKQVADLKKSLSEKINTDKSVNAKLKRTNDSLDWTREAIKNLIGDLDKLSTPISNRDNSQWQGVNVVTVKQRLQQILSGEQPTRKK